MQGKTRGLEMNTIDLLKMKNEAEIKVGKIERLLADKEAVEKAIEDLKHLQKHAGEMIFTGNSGKIGERDVTLKTVKINTLAGCVAIPKLLIELAEAKLKELEAEADTLTDALCDGTPEKFEDELFGLINRYIKCGLRKPDLLKKMKWATGNCEFS